MISGDSRKFRETWQVCYYAFCGRYCFESVASQNVNTVIQHLRYHILIDYALIRIDLIA